MGDSTDKPAIRPVEAIPTLHEGKRVVVLRDPEGYAEHPVVIGDRGAWILGLMDGEHSLVDIQAAYTRRYGDILFSTDLEKLIRDLDEACLLEGEGFRKKREAAERAYRDAPARPALHLAGYDANEETWGRWLGAFLGEAGDQEPAPPAGVRALVAPHIDLRLGGPVYGSAWKAALGGEPPELVVLIGTCHHPLPSLVSVTAKDFETPLGTVEADGDFLRTLDEKSGGGLFDDEIVHRREHAIEFQALFVRHLFGDRTRIAPVLCSYSPLHLSDEAPPEFGERIRSVAGALGDLVKRRGGRTLLVASADLSHVGPRYGDENAPDDEELRGLEESDRVYLEAAAAGDPGGLSRRLLETADSTRICGYPPMHLMLSALGGSDGDLLRYDQGVMGEEGSVVSFAAMAFQ
ncbi:MAG: AmmeMemoRadiSam system protein B [Candidatus Eisenbacteria bacterium]